MKEKLRQFMIGRYGSDELSKFLSSVAVATIILGIIWRFSFLRLLFWICIILIYYRMLSKDHAKRYAENQKFLALKGQIMGRFQKSAQQSAYEKELKKTHRLYKCPGCGQKIKVPKGKGKIMIRCPKCQKEFMKRS